MNPIYQHDTFLAIDFLQADFDDFGIARLDRFPNKGGLDGQLPMAPVNQHQKSDPAWSAQIEKPVHGGANRAAGVKNIIHDHQVAVIYGKINVCRLNHRLRTHGGKIIPVKSDIEGSHRNIHLGKSLDRPCEPLRKRNTPAPDTNQGKFVGAPALLHDFVG